MEYEKYCRRKVTCANCGKFGHEFKYCREPITSYGVINIDIINDTSESLIIKNDFSTKKNTLCKIISRRYPEIKCYVSDNIKLSDNNTYKLDNKAIPYNSKKHIEKFCYYRNKILFMMVSRKYSLGFIEFIRGKYDVSDAKSIINLFEQMYQNEIYSIKKNTYDDLLYHFLNRNNESKEVVLNRIYEGRYSSEYCEAKIKFNILKNPSEDENNDVSLDLDFCTRHIKPRYKNQEWGFPKGRRDKKTEENLACACREFEEETGYQKNNYTILNKIEPIEEKMTGTNKVNYKHIYYLAMNNLDTDEIPEDFDVYEIGEIRWFTYDEAMAQIRPYHVEKKKILNQVYLFILNYLVHNECEI